MFHKGKEEKRMYNRKLAKAIVDALWLANDDYDHASQRDGAFGPLATALRLVIGDKGYEHWVSTSELPDTYIGPKIIVDTGRGIKEG